jgi:hypothetical protein
MPKKVLVAFPPAMLEQIDRVAFQEHRTRSDLIRESMRRYLANVQPSTVIPLPIKEPNANLPGLRNSLETGQGS